MSHIFRRFRWIGLLLAGLIWAPLAVLAQGNQVPAWYGWHNVNQQYLRIFTNTNDIHRMPADSVFRYVPAFRMANLTELKLYYEGNEVPIYVGNGGNPGNDPSRFDEGDWVEFLGHRLDASIDSFMYRDPQTGRHAPDAAPVPSRALWSTQSCHYLTVSPGSGLRLAGVDGTATDGTEDTRIRQRAFVSYDGGYDEAARDWGTTWYNRGHYASSDYSYFLNSEYTPGEGYAGALIFPLSGIAIDFSTIGAVPAGQETTPPSVSVRYSTLWLVPHRTRIEVVSGSSWTYDFSGVGVFTRTNTFSQSELRNSGNNTRVQVSTLNENNDFIQVGEAWIDFDSRADFDNAQRAVIHRYTAGGAGIRRLVVRGINVPGGDGVVLHDFANRRRVLGRVQPGTLNASQADVHFRMEAGNPAELYITPITRIRQPIRYQAARFAPQRLAQPNNGADLLILAYPRASSSAEAYANYRRNDAPNHSRMSVQVVYVDQMLNEFGYGHQAPEVARQFFRYVYENWQRRPKFVLLWGDVYLPDYLDYVPTWGYPPTDYLLLTGYSLDRNDMQPWASIGRVTVQSDAEGFAYLDKVREYESMPIAPWMRQGLHLGGGTSLFEQQTIQAYLQTVFEPNLTTFPLLGSVDYYQKTGNDPVPSTVQQRIRNTINSGVTQLTFFGHSAATVFDIPLEPAANYNNQGKYPVVVALGCFSGDFVIGQPGQPNGNSYGEQYVKEAGKGAIAYTSVTGTGDLGALGEWARNYLRVALRDSAGKPLGNVFRRNYAEFVAQAPSSFRQLAHAQQMVLQGDPVIRQRLPTAPDFAASAQDIAVTTPNLTALVDELRVRLAIRNQGLGTEDSVALELQHQVPASGYSATIRRKVRLTRLQDTVTVTILRGNANWAGQNNLTLRLDPDNAFAELDEANNTATATLNLEGNIPLLLYPQPNALIDRDTVALVVGSFGGPSSTAQTYEVQVATDTTFAAPLGSATLTGSATGVNYRVPGTLQPNTVYYWRARNAGGMWVRRSFQRASTWGWEQRSPQQLAENLNDNLSYNAGSGRWQFASATRSGTWRMVGAAGPVRQWETLTWQFSSPDNPSSTTDWLDIRVYGRRADGTDSLAARVQGRVRSGSVNLASLLNPQRFPKAVLEVRVADTTDGTALQPDFVRMTFVPLVQDPALDPLVAFGLTQTDVAEGQPASLRFALRSLSPDAMTDSVPVRVNGLVPNQPVRLLLQQRLAPLGPHEQRIVTLQVPTLNLPASIQLQVQLNATGTIAEAQTLNNQWTNGELTVRPDRSNPLLEVLVDGRHLMSGDRVSPLPNIVAELRDDNPYIPLTDTTVMELFLRPSGSNAAPRRLTFASGELTFTPGSVGNPNGNVARVEFKPQTALADGRYELSVQGFDARSNPAGSQPYRVEFEVRNRPGVSHVLNYPNPFTTSTKFVYTLSGTEVPEVFQIHIHTITGRLVKVVDLKALGEVKLGTHLTDYAWDGTDEFGDRLANGVYLYRVVMRLPGGRDLPVEDEAGTGRYFKNGWGKMYLMK